MNLKLLLISAALPASLIISAGYASAQTTVEADQSTPLVTSTDGDVTVNDGVTISPVDGTAITVDSDNSVTQSGTISFVDVDDVVGVDLQGGNTGSYVQSGSISLEEDYTATDDDSDNVVDGPFTIGSGRTGILISGASPFAGNVTVETTGSISIEGQDSFGLRVMETAGLDGDISMQGVISILGASSRALSLEGDITGNVVTNGNLSTRGENASAIVASGDITGRLTNSGSITNSGYRFADRPTLTGRNLLGAEDLLQAGSAIQVNGNVTNGIFLQRVITTTENEDGTTTSAVTANSNVTQQGSAAAVLIDGQGTPIAIGMVALITDPDDENYVAAEQYAFVNQGTLTATGVYDDINATAFEVRDATLAGGINNTSTLSATAFRSGDDGTADEAGATGLARVIVFGDQAIADTINNSGVILASVSEASDEIYLDRDNVIAARDLQAVSIDIGATASLSSITNSGAISALLTGRNGEAIAIRDASGTLTMIENTGSIAAFAATSDAQGLQDINFNLIALDLSANTMGVTYHQLLAVDEDPDDDVSPVSPILSGQIILGSGDDVVNIEAGSAIGDISFGDGADQFSLSGESNYIGSLNDSDGNLAISVSGGSSLTQVSAVPINISSASFDGTSVFRPVLDGATGLASSLNATGDISFADGASIAPTLANVIGSTDLSFTVLDAGGTLSLGGDPSSLASLASPFLYNTSYAIDPNDPNALLITLDLRSISELGLDTVQSSSFNTAFQAMQSNSALANAFVNITEETEFNNALSQLLPEFAAAARQFVVANVDGAVGAVGTHLDNARKSQDKSGGAWIQEFAYFADRDLAGLSEQYRGHGFGITGGLDTALGPFHTVGVNVGFATTEIEDVVGVDEPLDVVTLQLGTYAGFATGNLGIEVYGGMGFNDFEASRNVTFSGFDESAQGDWKGTHVNASLRAGYDFDISDKFWARPAVSVDYLRLSEDGYTESGASGVALEVEKRTSEVGGVTAMLNFGMNFQGRRTSLSPSLRVGYRNEFINDGLTTTYGFVGGNSMATLIAEEFPNSGFLVGFSLAAHSPYSSLGFDFDSDIRDGFIRHTGRIVLRLIF